LKWWAKRHGFGEITHIVEVEVEQGTAVEVGAYAGKIATYTAKAHGYAERMNERGALRVRPVRSSRGWLPGGMRGVEAELGIRRKQRQPGDPPPRDGGPWAIIELDSRGEARWVRTVGDVSQLARAAAA
jgi:hypothetical protein